MANKFTLTSQEVTVAKAPAPVAAAPAPAVEEVALVEVAPAEPAAPPIEMPKERKFRLLADVVIKRGASKVPLAKGKILSSFGYDIEALRLQDGVQLEEVASG